MPYWLPPPLALPPHSKALRVLPHSIDLGAAWLLARRFSLYKDGDPYTLSQDEWVRIRGVGSHYGEAPTWTQPRWDGRRSRPRASYTSGWHTLLPSARLSPHHEVLALPFVHATHYTTQPHANWPCFALVRHEGERVRIYPRTLRHHRYNATPSSLFRAPSLPRLLPLWDAAFDALPAYATTARDVREGRPYVGASLSRGFYGHDGPDAHPFWRAAQHALCAALSLLRITPPPPPTYGGTFHWTVRAGPHRDPDNLGHYAPFPLKVVDLEYDGWAIFSERGVPAPPGVADKLAIVARALEGVLTQFAPSDPLFFDTLSFCDTPGPRYCTPRIDAVATGQHFPWIDKSLMQGVGSAHAAMAHLSELPTPWKVALLAALSPYLA